MCFAKGGKCNVKVEWENGKISYEPLHTIAADDPVTCATYAKEQGLLDIDGRKRFRVLAKRAKKMLCMVNQSKLCSYKSCKKYMYGIEIPWNYEGGVRLDKIHGNNKWQDATKLEMSQLHEYETFHDKCIGTTPGEQDTRRFESILCLPSSMMVVTKRGFAPMET